MTLLTGCYTLNYEVVSAAGPGNRVKSGPVFESESIRAFYGLFRIGKNRFGARIGCILM
ncbi:MAG: hypothetical protein Q7V05_04920 [Methanoregula sp.]|nr:hypothetical protein [Methanoregula sp.]